MDWVSQFLPRAFFVSCCLFASGQVGQGQPQADVATIERQIDTLEKQQQLILDKLNELESALSANGLKTASLPSTTDVRGENFRGGADAKFVIIEYADYECPFCGQFERDTVPELLKNYVQTGKVKFVYRDLPLHHPHAMLAARASRCAADQGKYWEMHDALFASQANLAQDHVSELAGSLSLDSTRFANCLASDKFTGAIQASVSQANDLGLHATPSFIIGTLANGGSIVHIDKRVVGAVPYEQLRTELDELLTSMAQTEKQ